MHIIRRHTTHCSQLIALSSSLLSAPRCVGIFLLSVDVVVAIFLLRVNFDDGRTAGVVVVLFLWVRVNLVDAMAMLSVNVGDNVAMFVMKLVLLLMESGWQLTSNLYGAIFSLVVDVKEGATSRRRRGRSYFLLADVKEGAILLLVCVKEEAIFLLANVNEEAIFLLADVKEGAIFSLADVNEKAIFLLADVNEEAIFFLTDVEEGAGLLLVNVEGANFFVHSCC